MKKKQLQQKKNEKFRGEFILIRSNRGKTKRGEQQKKKYAGFPLKLGISDNNYKPPILRSIKIAIPVASKLGSLMTEAG